MLTFYFPSGNFDSRSLFNICVDYVIHGISLPSSEVYHDKFGLVTKKREEQKDSNKEEVKEEGGGEKNDEEEEEWPWRFRGDIDCEKRELVEKIDFRSILGEQIPIFIKNAIF